MIRIHSRVWQGAVALMISIGTYGCGSNPPPATTTSVPATTVATPAANAGGAAAAGRMHAGPGQTTPNPGAMGGPPGGMTGMPGGMAGTHAGMPSGGGMHAAPAGTTGAPGTGMASSHMMKPSSAGNSEEQGKSQANMAAMMAQMGKGGPGMQHGQSGAGAPAMAGASGHAGAQAMAGAAGSANSLAAAGMRSGQGLASGMPGAPGGAGGQGANFPPGSVDETLFKFCTAMADGDTAAASEYVSAKAKGLLAKLRDGELSDEKIEEITTAIVPINELQPNQNQTNTKRSLRNMRNQVLSFTLKKDDDTYKLMDFSVSKLKKQ